MTVIAANDRFRYNPLSEMQKKKKTLKVNNGRSKHGSYQPHMAHGMKPVVNAKQAAGTINGLCLFSIVETHTIVLCALAKYGT